MAVLRYIVDDVAAATSFYTDVLGFAVEREMGTPFAMVSRGDLHLWLSGPGGSARRPLPDGVSPVAGGWNRLVLEVPDLPATVAKLRQAGAHFRNEIVTGPGGKQVLIEDPSGNPIELFQPASSRQPDE
jgi:catechol 2,3-dioxygenase-like lactoylglutathione lyase family enzyme